MCTVCWERLQAMQRARLKRPPVLHPAWPNGPGCQASVEHISLPHVLDAEHSHKQSQETCLPNWVSVLVQPHALFLCPTPLFLWNGNVRSVPLYIVYIYNLLLIFTGVHSQEFALVLRGDLGPTLGGAFSLRSPSVF